PARSVAVSSRPRQRRAVGLRRIGRGEHERLRLLRRLLRTQPLDRAGQRELRAAEPLDEVTAPRDAERLELRQLGVDRGETAGDTLREHLLAGQDAVALEQQLGERTAAGA